MYAFSLIYGGEGAACVCVFRLCAGGALHERADQGVGLIGNTYVTFNASTCIESLTCVR